MANPPNRSDVGDQNAVAAAIAGDAALQRLAMRDVPPARPSPPARRPEGFRWRAERSYFVFTQKGFSHHLRVLGKFEFQNASKIRETNLAQTDRHPSTVLG